MTGIRMMLRAAGALLALTMLSGCMTVYLDNQVLDVPPAERASTAHPQPVQLQFEFLTHGAINDKATGFIRQDVFDTVQASGLFSQVSSDPVPNGALLHITIDNVPLTDDPEGKGFLVGSTLGLVGATVGDGYICHADYQSGRSAPHIGKDLRDAIYASAGANAPVPEHADQMPDAATAVHAMIHRVVSNLVNAVGKDPAFGK